MSSGEGLTRRPGHLSKRAATCFSCSGCQRILCLYSIPRESASVGGSGDLADGKPLSQANSFLGNVTLKDEVPLFVLFVFDIPSNESVLHTGKGQMGLEKVQSQESTLFSFFFFLKFHLHWIYFSLTNNWFKTYTVYMNIFVNIYIYMLKCYTASTTKGSRHGPWGSLRLSLSLLWNKQKVAQLHFSFQGFQINKSNKKKRINQNQNQISQGFLNRVCKLKSRRS